MKMKKGRPYRIYLYTILNIIKDRINSIDSNYLIKVGCAWNTPNFIFYEFLRINIPTTKNKSPNPSGAVNIPAKISNHANIRILIPPYLNTTPYFWPYLSVATLVDLFTDNDAAVAGNG